MQQLDATTAFNQLKKLPFSKSWQNVHVSKVKKIVDTATGELVSSELGDFIYMPAPSLVRYFANDKEFLAFRSESKNSKEWDYKLLSDPVENNNRRLAVMWTDNILKALDINFLIDDGYTIYILYDEIHKLAASEIPGMKEFINGLYIPKTLAHRKGITETFGD